MNKLIALSVAALLTSASAQQKPTFAPVTIDGVTTNNGLVTLNGKSYVSVDALKAGGLTMLKTNSFGLYRFPNAQGVPLKLQGCMGEWLFNGVDKMRVDSVNWSEADKRYNVRVTVQTSIWGRSWDDHFSPQASSVVYSSGKVLQNSKNPIQRLYWASDAIGDPDQNKNSTATLRVIDPDDTGTETLTKLVITTGNTGTFGNNVMSFNLTCKK